VGRRAIQAGGRLSQRRGEGVERLFPSPFEGKKELPYDRKSFRTGGEAILEKNKKLLGYYSSVE